MPRGDDGGGRGEADIAAERARLPIGRATMPPAPQLEDQRSDASDARMEAARIVMDAYFARIDPQELPQVYPPEPEARDRVYHDLAQCYEEESGQLPPGVDMNAVLDFLVNEAVGLGALEYFLDDESVSEIFIHRPDVIVVEQEGRTVVSEHCYTSPDVLYMTVQRLLSMQGHTAMTAPPQSEVRFNDGTLVQVVLPPVAVGSPLIVVRKPRRSFPDLNEMVQRQVLSPSMAEFLDVCVQARRTILVAGPQGSGRTSLVNALASLIPDGARVVAVESTAMLQLPQNTAVSLETQPPTAYAPAVDAETLVRNAARLRPERMILDTVRGTEALGFLNIVAGGAAGSLAVVTALGAQDAVRRLEQLVQMAAPASSPRGVVQQVAKGIDVVVVMHRFGNGRRRVVEIAEVCGANGADVDLETLFTFELQGMGEAGEGSGRFAATSYVPRFYRELESGGVSLNSSIFRD